MGKIRVKALGDEELEKEQAEKAKVRKEARLADESKRAKKAEKQSETATEETTVDVKPVEKAPVEKKQKKDKFKKDNQPQRSKSYMTKADLIDKNKNYSLSEAIALLPQLKRAKFDETVEVHFTMTETGVSGSVSLPHGTGKQIRVTVVNGSDQKAVEDLVKKIEAGTIDFDVLVATPDAMPKLAKVARVLGPRGLMPNPKNGTVTPKPEEVAKRYEGGQINFKTEAKFPLLHIAVGKVSFGEDKIRENVKTVLEAIDKKKIRNATLKSTMSPAIRLDLTSL
ncbi:MAG TPA: 50S ribosomal protein L1 [Patescibacteria group bacterium]|nr:50S ribosomal protein L1 [Patescibacteria group bacterium]